MYLYHYTQFALACMGTLLKCIHTSLGSCKSSIGFLNVPGTILNVQITFFSVLGTDSAICVLMKRFYKACMKK